MSKDLLPWPLLDTGAGQAAVTAAYVEGKSLDRIARECFGHLDSKLVRRVIIAFVQFWAQTRWEPDMRPATYARSVAAYAVDRYRASLPSYAGPDPDYPGDDRRGRGGAVTPSPEGSPGRGNLQSHGRSQ